MTFDCHLYTQPHLPLEQGLRVTRLFLLSRGLCKGIVFARAWLMVDQKGLGPKVLII